MPRYKPFLKWPGNKFRHIERISVEILAGNRYVEPFLGSAAVFLNTNFPDYLLGESNVDLINLYQVLKEDGEKFIRYCSEYFLPEYNDEDYYYHYRDLMNQTPKVSDEDKRLRAALFLYLNKHGYNGLVRFNSLGKFNVPFGRYKKPFFPAEEMRVFYKKIKNVELNLADFSETMQQAKAGDVVYCDPPYVPLSKMASFTNYSGTPFEKQQQIQLAQLAEQLCERGVKVLISNHDTKWVRELYHRAKIISFKVQRTISCKPNNRGKANEVLAVFTPE